MNRMSTPPFVHLRLHSEYSVSDGIVRLDDAVAAALAPDFGDLVGIGNPCG